jgi:hypothetical protein
VVIPKNYAGRCECTAPVADAALFYEMAFNKAQRCDAAKATAAAAVRFSTLSFARDRTRQNQLRDRPDSRRAHRDGLHACRAHPYDTIFPALKTLGYCQETQTLNTYRAEARPRVIHQNFSTPPVNTSWRHLRAQPQRGDDRCEQQSGKPVEKLSKDNKRMKININRSSEKDGQSEHTPAGKGE